MVYHIYFRSGQEHYGHVTVESWQMVDFIHILLLNQQRNYGGKLYSFRVYANYVEYDINTGTKLDVSYA
jgi:hypothetical protein